MSFNIVNLKHREINESWLHVKDANGDLMHADDKKKKPVRIKFKSVHSDAFRKAFFKMNVRLAQLKDGKQKQYEELAKEKAEISHDEVVADITKAFLDAEDLAIDMITDLSIDWDGFIDQDGNALEFKPEYLRFVISQVENYHVLQQIRDAFKNAEDFMEA